MSGQSKAIWRGSVVVLLLAAAYLVNRLRTHLPTPSSGPLPINVVPAVEPEGRASSGPAAAYELSANEMLRHIAHPDAQARATQLRKLHKETQAPIISMTIEWDGDARLRNLQLGISPVPRSLYEVLVNSLQIPTYRLAGLELAHDIPLPGDWVVRRGAEPAECLAYVQEIVRRNGRPNLKFAAETSVEERLVATGELRAANDVLELFPPLDGAETAGATTGNPSRFIDALSKALGQPIQNDIVVRDAPAISWRDNSPAYLQTKTRLDNEQVKSLLDKIGTSLGITFETRPAETVIWRLRDSRK